MKGINRRDFLKFSMALPAAAALSRLAPSLLSGWGNQSGLHPNIIFIVVDTLSAKNMSLYGYPRKTTPGIEKFAQRATVYHSHHSAGNFTIPGTASLLTGTYPWTHRGMNFPGLIARELVRRNIFNIIGESYTRVAFTQNPWAMHLLAQFIDDIDRVVPPSSFSAANLVFGEKFTGDLIAANMSLDEFLFRDIYNPPPSLIFGIPERALLRRKALRVNSVKNAYPTGVPSQDFAVFFHLNEVFNGIFSTIEEFPSPYFAYFHLWGVHQPYAPAQAFYKMFRGGWRPEEKPRHPLAEHETYHDQLKWLNRYDEYIANFDFELGRLLDQIEQDGTLDSSYVFITSDHGESSERGTQGHGTPLMFEPLIHVPLLISAPGQRERVDVYAPTNSVDILPTLASITGQVIPEWCEGQTLPGFGGTPDDQRASFSIETKYRPQDQPIGNGSIAMQKGKYKLVRYKYGHFSDYELYDLENDPEELNNLYIKLPAVANVMQEQLLNHLDLANQRYHG